MGNLATSEFYAIIVFYAMQFVQYYIFYRNAIYSSFTQYKFHFCISNRYSLKDKKVRAYMSAMRRGPPDGTYMPSHFDLKKKNSLRYRNGTYIG